MVAAGGDAGWPSHLYPFLLGVGGFRQTYLNHSQNGPVIKIYIFLDLSYNKNQFNTDYFKHEIFAGVQYQPSYQVC